MRVAALGLSLFCLAIAAVGCERTGGDRVAVAGTVLLDGEPLTSGMIRFVPEVGRPASSAILSDGRFELASDSVNKVSTFGVPPGDYRVQVSALQVVDDETIRWKAPEKYADFRTSGLNVTINKPTHNLVIHLSWANKNTADRSEATENKNLLKHDRAHSAPAVGELPASPRKDAS
jgi:hypothetical protein